MEPVVDANVFIHGRGNYRFQKAYTVQQVFDEIKSFKGRNSLRNIDCEVRSPSEDSISKVRKKSEDINSPTSDADEELLALAMDLDKSIVTDDKPLQNLALHLGLEFEGFLDSPTDERYRWDKICKNCGKDVSGSKCGKCGSNRFRTRRVRCS